jgi:hypothetical protein
MELETWNILDEELDEDELMEYIFDYLLELDGKTETDDEIKETTKIEKIWVETPEMVTVDTIDDSKKQSYNKMYFNGEFDSSSTKYAFLSNHCNICTVAKTDKVGKVLQTFLREVINGSYPYSFINEFDGEVKKEFTIQEMVDLLEKYNDTYYHVCHVCDPRLGLYYDRELSGYNHKTKIHRFLPDVDSWNIYRIANALGIWSPKKQYKIVQ